jgi:hypothetical protein
VSPPDITGKRGKKTKEKEMCMMPFRPSKKPRDGSFTGIHTPSTPTSRSLISINN